MKDTKYKLVSRRVGEKIYHRIDGKREHGEGEFVDVYFKSAEAEFKRDKNLTKIVREIKHDPFANWRGFEDD